MFCKIYKFLFPVKYAIKNGMQVGKGVSFVSPRSTILGTEPYLIQLGDYVRVSGNVTFLTHDGGTWAFRYQEEYKNAFKYGRIQIGEHTFIGCGVTILPGIEIGKNCVIGAGSVVTKNVPDGSVWAGVPAKRICSIEEYAKKIIDLMPNNVDWENYQKAKKNELLKLYSKGKNDNPRS